MKKTIPDLRTDAEITMEHCFVLLHKLGETFDILEGTEGGIFKGLADEFDPSLMKGFYDQTFEPQAFSRLFQTEIGKGVLVGAYAQELLGQMEDFADEHEEEF